MRLYEVSFIYFLSFWVGKIVVFVEKVLLIVLLEVFYSVTYLDKRKFYSNKNNWMSDIFLLL